MCGRRLAIRKNEFLAWWRQFIHPVFLTIRDSKLQREFNEQQRREAYHRLCAAAVLLTIYFVVQVISKRHKLDEQTPFFVQYGSITLTSYLFVGLGKLRPWMVDIAPISAIVIRCIITFLLFKFILKKADGF